MNKYDVILIGGGLAGLASAILLGREGYRVLLFEKEVYPFHKVCGEYISLEIVEFLHALGVPLKDWNLPVIDTLELSSPNGNKLSQKLPLGGIGVSRFRLDFALMELAKCNNVEVCDGTKVDQVQFINDVFIVSAGEISVTAKVCCGAFGKRSNLDLKWKRDFIQQKPGVLNNFIGIKYHAKLNHSRNLIALHNFAGGYCGISPVENNSSCICYLTNAANLRRHGNSIEQMEKNVLSVNPHLKRIFNEAEIIYEKPLVISQISFEKKEQVYDHILLLGDAAGLITPLCGNGMSMALKASSIAMESITAFLKGTINRSAMEENYAHTWKSAFARRLLAGRMIQGMFARQWLTNSMVCLLRPFPVLTQTIIRQTHG